MVIPRNRLELEIKNWDDRFVFGTECRFNGVVSDLSSWGLVDSRALCMPFVDCGSCMENGDDILND